ncbi:MAG: 50S ribosomal protein L4 [Dehalococcoidia bacterium]|nr:50S ribosomal protein L4 [Dehalococcoidia bacterium]
MQVPVYDVEGNVVRQIEISDAVFGAMINAPVMHQAVLRQLANARQGTAATKTRGKISGGGRKPFRQKGTGRARQGSTRAPQFRGGGIVFGPSPRSYTQALPRKMRRLALRSALSVKLAEQQLVVVDQLALSVPKTKEMKAIIDRLPVVAPILIVTPGREDNVYKSGRNLGRVTVIPVNNINIVDVLRHSSLIMPIDTIRRIEVTLDPGIRWEAVEDGDMVQAESQIE